MKAMLEQKGSVGRVKMPAAARDSSTGRVLAVQEREFELVLRTHIKKPGSMHVLAIPAQGEAETGRLPGLAGQPGPPIRKTLDQLRE